MAGKESAEALRNQLYARLGLDRVAQGTVYLSYVEGGIPCSEEFLEFAKHHNEDFAYSFARLVNSIPPPDGDWSFTNSFLYDIYDDWIKNYDAPKVTLSSDEQKEYNAAIAYIDLYFDKYHDYKKHYNEAAAKYYSMLNKSDVEKDENPNYKQELSSAQHEMTKLLKEWEIRGYKSEYEKHDGICIKYTGRDNNPDAYRYELSENLFHNMRNLFDGRTYCNTVPILSNAVTGAGWQNLTFSLKTEHQFEKKDKSKWGGKASAGALFWTASAAASGSRTYTSLDVDLKELTLTFEFCRIGIDRPWFKTLLLESNGRVETNWRLKDQSPENPPSEDKMLSNGLYPPHAEGLMWGYASELIVVRNIEVTFSSANKTSSQLLKEFNGQASGGIGFFSFGGSNSLSTGVKELRVIEGNNSLRVEGMQIVGFLCHVVAKAPNPNWKLWNL